jgi:hypothetical protein
MIALRTICRTSALALAIVTTIPLRARAGTWRSQWDSPKSVMERSSPSRVRVVLEDSSTLILEHPRIAADSLVGTMEAGRRAVPFSAINHLDLKKGSGLGAAAGISLVLIGGFLGLLAATWD